MLKITTAQLNFTIGDLSGNVAKMVTAARRAWDEQSDLVVFSEMSLTAYYPGDLLEEEGFVERVDLAFQELLQASRQIPNLHWVIGLPARHTGPGKKLSNALRVIKGGEVLLEYAKQLLPTYNIFDERRHFEPGPDVAKVLRVRDMQVGLLICEARAVHLGRSTQVWEATVRADGDDRPVALFRCTQLVLYPRE